MNLYHNGKFCWYSILRVGRGLENLMFFFLFVTHFVHKNALKSVH